MSVSTNFASQNKLFYGSEAELKLCRAVQEFMIIIHVPSREMQILIARTEHYEVYCSAEDIEILTRRQSVETLRQETRKEIIRRSSNRTRQVL